MSTTNTNLKDILAKRTLVTPGAGEFFDMVGKATNGTVLMTKKQEELLIEELCDVAKEYESSRAYFNRNALRKFARREAIRIAKWVNTCKGF